jgi:hypothetical protein
MSQAGAILDGMKRGQDRATTGHGLDEKLLVDLIRRFRRLTPEQKIRATMLNNRATLKLRQLWSQRTS